MSKIILHEDFKELYKVIKNDIDVSKAIDIINLGIEETTKMVIGELRKKVENQEVKNFWSTFLLGLCFLHGVGVQHDSVKALEYVCDAASHQNPYILVFLADQYYYGANDVEKNYEKSIEYLKAAAEQDYAEAQYKLGDCYWFGHGVPINYKKAISLYEAAASQGFAAAQFDLGLCYECGTVLPCNMEKAITLYEAAAAQDYFDALMQLSDCYMYGRGVEIDFKKAYELEYRAQR